MPLKIEDQMQWAKLGDIMCTREYIHICDLFAELLTIFNCLKLGSIL